MLEAQAAGVAYDDKRYLDCARLYASAAELAAGRAKAEFLSTAGACELRSGRRAKAIEHFRRAVQTHISYCDDIVNDASLQKELSDEPQWAAAVAAMKPACTSYMASLNTELLQIHREDQEDRKPGFDKINWSVIEPRDIARRERVGQLEAAGYLRSADDYYHAAMIMQHGSDERSYAEASRLASRAVVLDSTFVKARWLVAASKDRYHMSRGEPQLYGTQSKRVDGEWILWPVDPHVSDHDRAEWCVEPLEHAKQRVNRKNGNRISLHARVHSGASSRNAK